MWEILAERGTKELRVEAMALPWRNRPGRAPCGRGNMMPTKQGAGVGRTKALHKSSMWMRIMNDTNNVHEWIMIWCFGSFQIVPGRVGEVFTNKDKVTHIELSSSLEANLTFWKTSPNRDDFQRPDNNLCKSQGTFQYFHPFMSWIDIWQQLVQHVTIKTFIDSISGALQSGS